MSAPKIFDRALLGHRRARAARTFSHADFLKREISARLAERLGEVNRPFQTVADLGCHTGGLGCALTGALAPDILVSLDLSPAMAGQAPGFPVAASEEALPLKPGGFDLIVSALSLHWVNDLPGTLAQIFQALKPDGLFIGALFGGETLKSLRDCLMAAELEETGGASPRISPFIDIRDGGALLQRAGFALPVADMDQITIDYATPLGLLGDLRAMGETNILVDRHRGPLRRAVLTRAMALYQEKHGDAAGRVTARFDILWLTGWHPHGSQQQPLKPGSAQMPLADALAAKANPADGE